MIKKFNFEIFLLNFFLIVFFSPIIFADSEKLLIAGDFFSFPEIFLSKLDHFWNMQTRAGVENSDLSPFLLTFYFSAFLHGIFDFEIANRIFYIFPFFFSLNFNYYFFCKNFKNQGQIIFALIFFHLNPWTISRFLAGHNWYLYFYFSFPILFYVIYKFFYSEKENRKKYSFFLAIVWGIILMLSGFQPSFLVLILILFFLVFRKESFSEKFSKIFYLGISGIFIFVLNSFWIFPMIYRVFSTKNDENLVIQKDVFLSDHLSQNSDFRSVISLKSYWWDDFILFSDTISFFEISDFYDFFMMILFLFSLFFSLKFKKYEIFLFLIFTTIFATGSFYFDNFYNEFTKKSIIFQAFRNPNNFLIMHGFFYSVMIFKLFRKMTVRNLNVFITMFYVILISVFSSFYGNIQLVKYPDEYTKSVDFLSSKIDSENDDVSRTILLPGNITNHFNWSHKDTVEPFRFMTDLRLLNPPEQPLYTNFSNVNSEMSKIKYTIFSDFEIDKTLQNLQVKYIFIRTDFSNENLVETYENYFFERNEKYDLIYKNDHVKIFENKNFQENYLYLKTDKTRRGDPSWSSSWFNFSRRGDPSWSSNFANIFPEKIETCDNSEMKISDFKDFSFSSKNGNINCRTFYFENSENSEFNLNLKFKSPSRHIARICIFETDDQKKICLFEKTIGRHTNFENLNENFRSKTGNFAVEFKTLYYPGTSNFKHENKLFIKDFSVSKIKNSDNSENSKRKNIKISDFKIHSDVKISGKFHFLSESENPVFVFSESYNPGWKLTLFQGKEKIKISYKNHFLTEKYKNAWKIKISNENFSEKQEIKFELNFKPDKIWLSL